jgi:hypothetical protein
MKSFILDQSPQGSPEWLKARLGVITASQVYALLPDSRTKAFKYKEARKTYMNELIGEVCTGYQKEIHAKALQWGKDNEDAAIAAYEFASGNEVEKIGLVYKDESKRAGASADFMVKGQEKGGEVKNPIEPVHHINFLDEDFMKPEYEAQIQFGMWVFGWDFWEFGSHHPRMKKKNFLYITRERDLKLMEYFDNEIPAFSKEMDAKLAKIGVSWGEQWS